MLPGARGTLDSAKSFQAREEDRAIARAGAEPSVGPNREKGERFPRKANFPEERQLQLWRLPVLTSLVAAFAAPSLTLTVGIQSASILTVALCRYLS